MIKRPLHAQFGPKVLADIKRTTIRATSWPVRKPIMLYHWSGKPYHSPHQNVAAVEVVFTCQITIAHINDGIRYLFTTPALFTLGAHLNIAPKDIHLWQLEGFDSQDAMDARFRSLVKPGHTLQRHLMLFQRLPTEN